MAVEVVEHLSDKQIEDVRTLYEGVPWRRDQPVPDVKRLLKHSDVVVALRDLDARKIIAFSRVITDFVCVAFVLDLMVDPTYRGAELERLLLDTILHHPKLLSVETFEARCRPEQMSTFSDAGFNPDDQVQHLHRQR